MENLDNSELRVSFDNTQDRQREEGEVPSVQDTKRNYLPILGIGTFITVAIGIGAFLLFFNDADPIEEKQTVVSTNQTTNVSSVAEDTDDQVGVEEGFEVYSNDNLGFSIVYPTDEDLLIDVPVDGCVRFNIGEGDEANEMPYFIVSQVPVPNDPEGVCGNMWEGREKAKDTTHTIEIIGKDTTGTKIGYAIEGESEKNQYEFVYSVQSNDGDTFEIKYSFSTAQGKVYRSIFEKMAGSLEWK